MPKKQIRQKKQDKFWSGNKFLNWKILNYFNNLKIRISQLIVKILFKQRSLKQTRHCLTGHTQIWHYFCFFLSKKKFMHFNDFQNQNFSVLWLKWIHTIKMKENQTIFHGTYSSLTSYLFFIKNIKVFQWYSKSKFLSFMTKANLSNGNETKWDIFLWDIFKSNVIYSFIKNIKVFQWL